MTLAKVEQGRGAEADLDGRFSRELGGEGGKVFEVGHIRSHHSCIHHITTYSIYTKVHSSPYPLTDMSALFRSMVSSLGSTLLAGGAGPSTQSYRAGLGLIASGSGMFMLAPPLLPVACLHIYSFKMIFRFLTSLSLFHDTHPGDKPRSTPHPVNLTSTPFTSQLYHSTRR